jgi:hypothetical protein
MAKSTRPAKKSEAPKPGAPPDEKARRAPSTRAASREAVEAREAAVDHTPEEDAIARRAYEIYESRGGDHGGDLDDWLQAEREVRERPRDQR